MTALAWLGAYLAILLISGIAISARKAPTLYTGQSFLFFNAIFIGAASALVLLAGRPVPLVLIICFAGILLGSFAVRKLWIVFRAEENRIGSTIESCLTMTRAPFVKREGGYILKVGKESSQIAVREALGSSVLISFPGGRPNKKLHLVKALIRKQFPGVLPRLRIRTK